MLILEDKDFIAKGSERACYTHSEDSHKTVKVTYKGNQRKKYTVSKRGIDNFKSLPICYLKSLHF